MLLGGYLLSGKNWQQEHISVTHKKIIIKKGKHFSEGGPKI